MPYRVVVVEASDLRAGDRVLAGLVLSVERMESATSMVTITVQPDEGDTVRHHYLPTQRLRVRRSDS